MARCRAERASTDKAVLPVQKGRGSALWALSSEPLSLPRLPSRSSWSGSLWQHRWVLPPEQQGKERAGDSGPHSATFRCHEPHSVTGTEEARAHKAQLQKHGEQGRKEQRKLGAGPRRSVLGALLQASHDSVSMIFILLFIPPKQGWGQQCSGWHHTGTAVSKASAPPGDRQEAAQGLGRNRWLGRGTGPCVTSILRMWSHRCAHLSRSTNPYTENGCLHV